MLYLVFSDIHGNLPALQTMLSDAGRVDGYVCLGDVVNYGPWSNECLDLIGSLPNCTLLRGNHEDAFVAGQYPGDNKLVAMFSEHCLKTFARHSAIAELPESAIIDKFVCRHTLNSEYIFPSTSVMLDRNYFIGHSHVQFRYCNSGYLLYNPGSVGQNRQCINVAEYLLFDTDAGHVTLRESIYNEELVLSEMRRLDYPQACLDYYDRKPRRHVETVGRREQLG